MAGKERVAEWGDSSGEDAFDDLAVNVGETELAALVTVREGFVIDAAEVHDGGLHIMHMHRVFGDVPCEIVSLAVGRAAADSASGKPHRIGAPEVIAAAGFCGIPLTEGSPSELAAPHHEGVLQQSSFFQIEQQGGAGSVCVAALLFQLGEEVAVLVPAGVHELHEPSASFEKAACDQGVVRERAFC